MSAGRASMSIGQVLATLRPEFPDVSVSKIRFLEGEGLVSPERTASGYRKFGEEDLERLRFILRLQRDSFIPLKVIRQRLAAGEAAPPPPPKPVAVAPAGPAPDEDEFARQTQVQLTEPDLAGETGLDLGQIRALREFGVLCPHGEDGSAWFDADDVMVGKLAHGMIKLGLEPRHLRALRRSAEQEAGLFEQLVTPVMRNRRPEVRAQAAETLTELARLGRALHRTYVRQSLRALLDGEH